MRILYDGLIYSAQKAGGISRYFQNLISRLPQDVVPNLLTAGEPNFNFPKQSQLKNYSYQKFRPGRISNQVQKLYFEYAFYRANPNLIHPTYYQTLLKKDLQKICIPIVVTVHDMIHEIKNELAQPNFLEVIEQKKKAIFRADAIICVSENTKKDLLELYSLPEEKVKVTHLATNLNIDMSYGQESVPEIPYYLYVGSRSKYKNFQCLLYAFAKVVSSHTEVKLCVVGDPFRDDEKQLISELNITNHVIHYFLLSDNHLAKLYRCSIALVYPSLYEGFGIPPLEAMACGTVAIASDCSSIPEVVGDAGFLFDPESTLELADIMESLIDSPINRNHLIAKGKKQTELFNWNKTAAQTLEVYRSLM